MDALGLETLLINSSLQSLVQELTESEAEHIIELELFIREKPVSVHAVEQCCTLEQTPWVFLF